MRERTYYPLFVLRHLLAARHLIGVRGQVFNPPILPFLHILVELLLGDRCPFSFLGKVSRQKVEQGSRQSCLGLLVEFHNQLIVSYCFFHCATGTSGWDFAQNKFGHFSFGVLYEVAGSRSVEGQECPELSFCVIEAYARRHGKLVKLVACASFFLETDRNVAGLATAEIELNFLPDLFDGVLFDLLLGGSDLGKPNRAEENHSHNKRENHSQHLLHFSTPCLRGWRVGST